jgi:inosine/xanthosine triphosphatase
MRLAVGTKRAVKLESVRQGTRGFADEVVGCAVSSGVSDQPRGLEETFAGAHARAKAALEADEKADAGIGLEAGLVAVGGRLIDVGFVCIVGGSGICGTAFSLGVALPDRVAQRVEVGQELAEAVAAEYQTNTDHDRDASVVLTQGKLPVIDFYRQAVELAVVDYLRQQPK